MKAEDLSNYKADWGSADIIVRTIFGLQKHLEDKFILAESDPTTLSSILSPLRSFYANYKPFIGGVGQDAWKQRIAVITKKVRENQSFNNTVFTNEGGLTATTVKLCLNDDYYALLDELRDAYDEIIQIRQKVGGGLPSKKLQSDRRKFKITRESAAIRS